MMAVALLLLSGCVVRSGGYGYSETAFAVGGPQVAFRFSDGVDAYYEPAFGTYIYGAHGDYYRWRGDGWVYATYYDGPWVPVVATAYLPPLLVYGPPPPIVRDRRYFVWWRRHAARWYAIHHPHWWYRHHFYMRHYAAWRAHVVRYYENHPGRRPAMRALFHRREQRIDHRRGPRPLARPRQNRFYDHRRRAQRRGLRRYRRPFIRRAHPMRRARRPARSQRRDNRP